MAKTPTESPVIESADGKWATFMAQLEAAEEQFVRRQPAAFKALWSEADDISICGAFGGIVKGRDEVGQRLDWASAHFSEGTRSRKEISVVRGSNLAHVVQTEWIRYRLDQSGYATLELRVSMAFRLEEGGWRILHRHADPNLDVAPASGPESL
jgi:ketosteroid isomerase-like protein